MIVDDAGGAGVPREPISRGRELKEDKSTANDSVSLPHCILDGNMRAVDGVWWWCSPQVGGGIPPEPRNCGERWRQLTLRKVSPLPCYISGVLHSIRSLSIHQTATTLTRPQTPLKGSPPRWPTSMSLPPRSMDMAPRTAARWMLIIWGQ